jgi:hypothetical protein
MADPARAALSSQVIMATPSVAHFPSGGDAHTGSDKDKDKTMLYGMWTVIVRARRTRLSLYLARPHDCPIKLTGKVELPTRFFGLRCHRSGCQWPLTLFSHFDVFKFAFGLARS